MHAEWSEVGGRTGSPSCPHWMDGWALETRIATTHPTHRRQEAHTRPAEPRTGRRHPQCTGRIVGGCWGLRVLTGTTVPPDTVHLLAVCVCGRYCDINPQACLLEWSLLLQWSFMHPEWVCAVCWQTLMKGFMCKSFFKTVMIHSSQ